ncbi:hypothetical protein CROQUDRAFT_85153 [Cronartium quercuum f. sp. fusiforme G11]|uniref:Uncharacterized protein n=1 Tax=Cronartium quercuum f. sp. fusiforme G11 TaxID=708437 RepID=A0A9P6N576_9BASI|nr:hypothetical protein CROQUDRAFT_85153 [Cronartium quercuum f. sp. fusiforme G11]
MAGPNLELVKFGMYVFFPIALMIHYGDPEWYRKFVLPDKREFLRMDRPEPTPPRNMTELKRDLQELKNQRDKRLLHSNQTHSPSRNSSTPLSTERRLV